MKPCSILFLAILGTLLLLTACGGSNGTPAADGGNAVSVTARTVTIPAGDTDCPFGGSLVETGIDENGNGLLDNNEVDNTEKVCNGADGSNGLNSLVAINEEPAGANCTDGGIKIETGLDANGNDTLDAGEVARLSYVCNVGPVAILSNDEFVTGSWSFQRLSLVPTSAAPATPAAGMIYYDEDDDEFCFYSGSQWVLLGGAVAIGSQCM